MVVFPNCKINLGLYVIQKRSDGFHNLETAFYPIPLFDVLEVIAQNDLSFHASGMSVPGPSSTNLCLKAYHLLKADFDQIPPVSIHLHKAIPMGAGLGGGSSNGAFMLTLLNQLFYLQLSEEQLAAYALQLGSDCPFFITNKPAYATGRGEHLNPIDLDLQAYKILIVNPGIHISTAEAFANIHPQQPVQSITEILHQPIETWRYTLSNDFEKSINLTHPEIADIKATLYQSGALYAAMSGSGSSIYGIYPKGTYNLTAIEKYYHKWVQ